MFLTFNVRKIKNWSDVKATSNHNLRIGNFGKNVDSDLTADNLSYSIGDATPYDSIRRLWKEVGEQREQLGAIPLRNTTNKAVEIIVGASSEFFDNLSPKQTKQFFIDQMNWLRKEYAGKGTLVSAVVHMDEPAAAPHMQAVFAPIKNKATKIKGGKEVVAPTFTAKEMLGDPTALRLARDNQFKALGEKWGLKQGERYDDNTDPEKVKRDKMTLQEFKKHQDAAMEMLMHFDIDALRQTAIRYATSQNALNKINNAYADNDKEALAKSIVTNQNKPK